MDPVKKIDLHMHTTFSDGTDTPAEILKRVKETGLTVFSVTVFYQRRGVLLQG